MVGLLWCKKSHHIYGWSVLAVAAAWAEKSFVLLNFYCSLNLWRQCRHSTGLGFPSTSPGTTERWLYRFYFFLSVSFLYFCFCLCLGCIKSQPTSLGISSSDSPAVWQFCWNNFSVAFVCVRATEVLPAMPQDPGRRTRNPGSNPPAGVRLARKTADNSCRWQPPKQRYWSGLYIFPMCLCLHRKKI